MPTLYATIGLPASGKTTAAKSMVAAGKGSVTEISKDDLRLSPAAPQERRAQEAWVLQEEDRIIRAALDQGLSIVVHDTNLNPYHAKRLAQIARECSAELTWLDFRHVPVSECIERDSQRPNPVGKDVILNMHQRYLKPKRRIPRGSAKLDAGQGR